MKRFLALGLFFWLATVGPVHASQATTPTGIRAPTADTQDFQALAHGFPAISADRRRVAVAATRTSGPQDFRSLLIVTWDVARGRRISTERIATEKDRARAPASAEAIGARIAATNRRLAAGGFSSMMTLLAPESPGLARLATGAESELEQVHEGFRIRFSREDGQLVVMQVDSGRTLLRRTLLPKPNRAPHCLQNPAIPDGVWFDAAGRVLVVRVAYLGTDVCVEPPEEWVIVRF